MSDFDRALAAAGWCDAYDRVSGHVYYVRPQSLHTRLSTAAASSQLRDLTPHARCVPATRQYHVDGRTTWTNPLPAAAEDPPAARTAEAAAGDMLSSSPASIKRHVEERISARHRERAATLALATVVHESPEVASKLVSLQKGRAARGRRTAPSSRRRPARRTSSGAADADAARSATTASRSSASGAPTAAGSGAPTGSWSLGLSGILEASSLADGSIDQLAFDEMVESAEKEQSEARTPRTPVGRPAAENCPPPPVTPPPSGAGTLPGACCVRCCFRVI